MTKVIVYTKQKGKQELAERGFHNLIERGELCHREDGPAVEYNGDKQWFINGKRHREDGPAIEYSSGILSQHKEFLPAKESSYGDKYWYIDDRLHREDGPAIEYSNGHKYWFINDEEYFETEYNKLLEEIDSLEPILGLIDPRDWVRKRFERKYKI